MREEEFNEIVKNQALKKANNRCERCWDSNDLEFHHKIPIILGGKTDLENCIVLCHNCHDIVPKDLVILEEIFLRFSSIKEMCQYYDTEIEEKAIEKLCQERNLNKEEIIEKFKESKFSKANLIRERMTEKAKKGKILGFNIPFGYDYKDGKLIVNEKEAEVVKEIFENYISGKTIKKVVYELNQKEIKTKKGNDWNFWSLRHLLHNPIYVGYLRWDNLINKSEHAQIIDKETFNKVQILMNKKYKNPKKDTKKQIL